MSKYLDDFAKNNDPPSDKALSAVRELLSGPLKQLEETNSKLARLKALIYKLLEKRVQIEESIDRYKCILAPIRRVPTDILHTIFQHCLPPDRNPSMSVKESPMILTRVCSSWRAIALSSPRLWAQIYIPFRREHETSVGFVGQPTVPLEEVVDVLRLRCQAAKEWLSRSGNCTISITISFHWGSDLGSNFTEQMDKSTILLLDTVLSFSSRIKYLDVFIPTEVLCGLENMVSIDTLLMLEVLKMSVYRGSWHSPGLDNGQALTLLRSPNLKRLSTNIIQSGDLYPPWWRLREASHVPWHNITHLAEHSGCTVQDFFTLLKYCQQLVYCEFYIADSQGVNIREEISLPRLLSLSIKETLSSSEGLYSIYDHIHAPQLRRIRYRIDSYVDVSAAPSMLLLIERATCLNELDIDRVSLSPQTVLKVLQTVSQNDLTRLVLNWKTNSYAAENTVKPDPFDLSLLIIHTDCCLDLTSGRAVLLPRLEEFELYTTRASDDTVMRFVTSRMDPLSNIAVLRKVKVVFDRVKDEEKGLDIVSEIGKRGDMANIKISLEFSYASPFPYYEYNDPLSPSFVANYPQLGWEDTWV